MPSIARIHKKTDTTPTSAEWERFFEVAATIGLFPGGNQGVLDRLREEPTSRSIFHSFASTDLEGFGALRPVPLVRLPTR